VWPFSTTLIFSLYLFYFNSEGFRLSACASWRVFGVLHSAVVWVILGVWVVWVILGLLVGWLVRCRLGVFGLGSVCGSYNRFWWVLMFLFLVRLCIIVRFCF